MRYLSVCSGIEAATVAWNPLGWEAAAFSEIEKFPRQVLAHHYPEVPLHGDFTTIKGDEYGTVDLLVGGTPCQSFSVAGLRKGLDDPRGNLMLEYGSLARRLGARWLVWENVPGVLSANGGRDFGTFLGMLAELGYGFAYRVLDAQFFGVAQRRRRVFVVGYLGDWRSAAAVLFERDSLCGNPAPSRKAGQEVAGTITRGAFSGGASGRPEGAAGNHFVAWPAEIAPTLNASFGSKQGLEDQHIRGGQDCSFQVAKCLITKTRLDAETETPIPTNGGHFSFAPQVVHGTQDPCVSEIAFAQGRNNGGENVLVQPISFGVGEKPDVAHCYNPEQPQVWRVYEPDGVAPTLQSGEGRGNAIMSQMQVRRLTPIECERLQGFPDNYTDIKPNGKPTPDGPRYKALGNSMAVPVMAWIGKRIAEVEKIKTNKEAA